MDFQRLFLFLIFSFSVLLLWDNWQHFQHPAAVPVKTASSAGVPAVTTQSTKAGASGVENASSSQVEKLQKIHSGQSITVKTDVLDARINTVGGDLRRLVLLKHRDAKDKNKPLILMQDGHQETYIAQSGLLGNGLPTHNTEFKPEQGTSFKLAEGKNELQVRLDAETADGIKVTKIYTFHRGSYVIDVSYEINNESTKQISPSAYFQLVRDTKKAEGDSKFVPTYTGPAVYTAKEKFQKVSFSDISKDKEDYPKKSDDGWIAMLEHYFVSAWLPQGNVQREFYTKKLNDDLYSAGVILPVHEIAPGKVGKITISLYAGPAKSSLDKIAPGLGLTVDYGWVTIIATPLFSVLAWLHGWVGNWGIAIIILTFLIKLIFFPLSAASYRSMAKMRVVAPKLEKIKKQYGDDRERLHKAMMELYKTEKINPLGGCLPIVIQIPVFVSLYWAILSSVELRHAPFFGWIQDLSAADPYYILPLLMGASMFVQTKLNPPPPDPMQAKLMQVMPLIFSVVFFFFPAGLVLYSVVNNVLSITQQWYITRKLGSLAAGASKA